MSGQFELYDCVLLPLTPIHIGGGEEAKLLPEDYRLGDGVLERVSLRGVLNSLPEAERAQWLAQMARARGTATVNVMRDVLQALQRKATEAEVLERIPISAESARAVDLSGEGETRKNQIDAFFRSGGRPCLPGSTLKGALRTAWAAACAKSFGPPRLPPAEEWVGLPQRTRATHAAGAIATLFALAGGKRAQDTDPFRDVTVADAPLPEGATRIDRVVTWKRLQAAGRQGRGAPDAWGFETVGEIHRERLRSVADGGEPPVITLTIGLRQGAVRVHGGQLDPTRRPRPERSPKSLDSLLAALEAQHAPLWRREVEEKFFAGPAGARLRDVLALFAAFARDGVRPEAALVRLGWASHAEAKSLPGLRRIERPQAKGAGRFAPEGTTRHVVNLNGHPLPFGWALLIRAEAWARKRPSRWLDPPVQRAVPVAGHASHRAAPADARAGTALGQRLKYRKGQKVRLRDGEIAKLLEDVTEAMTPADDVRADVGGDIETISLDEILGPA